MRNFIDQSIIETSFYVGGYCEEYHSSLFTLNKTKKKYKNNYKNKQTVTYILLTVEKGIYKTITIYK